MQSSSVSLQKIRPAISWPGGKTTLLPHILPRIPAHVCYCEPFAGGLAVLLAKPRSKCEVVNDLNGELVRFYRVVKWHRDALLEELEFMLRSRADFYELIAQPGLTDIQRAARWFCRNKNSFGGMGRHFGTMATQGFASRENRLDSIRQLNARLDKVCVENLDWERCLEIYDRKETFFFVDPPYTECSETSYAVWDHSTLERLRARLDQIKGRYLLTINDTAKNRAVFKGCRIEEVQRQAGIEHRKERKTRDSMVYRELLVSPR